MKNSKYQKKRLYYTSSVRESTKKGELFIELYPCSQNNNREEAPIKTIRNFDELIDFFENEETEE